MGPRAFFRDLFDRKVRYKFLLSNKLDNFLKDSNLLASSPIILDAQLVSIINFLDSFMKLFPKKSLWRAQ